MTCPPAKGGSWKGRGSARSRGRGDPLPLHPPPHGKFRSPGDVSPLQVSVASSRVQVGRTEANFVLLKLLPSCRGTSFRLGKGRMGLNEGFGEPGNLCAFAKFAKYLGAHSRVVLVLQLRCGRTVTRRYFN